jgi:hypothetical protein
MPLVSTAQRNTDIDMTGLQVGRVWCNAKCYVRNAMYCHL